MKRLISVILVLLMLLIPLGASAEVQEDDPTLIKMGDVNKDKKITAMDARLILRYSAKIDKAELSTYSADADSNGKITASDARIVLRVAAGLTQLTCGFDGNGIPCAINTILSNRYVIEASYDETGTGKGVKTNIELSVDNNNIYFVNYTSEFDAEAGSNAMFGRINGIGMLLIGENMYAVMLGDEYDFAIPITDALIDAMGKDGDLFGDGFALDAETLRQTSGIITSLITDDLDAPEKVNYGGDEAFCYSYTKNGDNLFLYTDLTGRLISICIESNGKILSLIDFTSVSGDKPTECFNISNYELIELF